MVVKSKKKTDHLEDLEDVFTTLRKYGMKLNPAKCSFGVASGQFLGHVVSRRGIEANPTKVQELKDLTKFETQRDIQGLTGRLAALNRFISRLSDRARPFFKVIKRGCGSVWGPEQQEAFDKIKEYMSSAPILAVPRSGEHLYCYLAVSDIAVSAALLVDRDGTQQPVFFVSKTLEDAETRYNKVEKLVLALITAKRKLRQYFEAHTINVLTSYPMKAILAKPDQSGRMDKWAIELGAFDIRYLPRTTIKGQAVADFLVEYGVRETNEDAPLQESPEDQEVFRFWKLHVDGSSTDHGSGAGILLETPDGTALRQSIRINFPSSNNVAEYEALIAGLRYAISLEVEHVRVYSDSLLVVNQLNGAYQAKDPRMEAYKEVAQKLASQFTTFTIERIPRDQNQEADGLACAASASAIDQKKIREIPQEVLEQPSILGSEEMMQVEVVTSWMDPYIQFLSNGTLPEQRVEARKLTIKAARYALIKGKLYRRSFGGPYLRCLRPDEADIIMTLIHSGDCGNHSGGRTLAHKVMTEGYYWPYMMRKAEEFVKKCDKCQRFAPYIHQPPQDLNPIASPWPFAQWGLDIVGILPTTPNKKRYVLLATDYFTKWVEAKAYFTITQKDVRDFIWENIICRFGLPNSIVTDNGTPFDNRMIREFCQQHGVRQHFSSTFYPQGNGQAEITNRTIFNCIKKKLEDRKGKWAEELHKVLWAYRTTRRQPTGETPFALAYGTEAVIPTEIQFPTLKSEVVKEGMNDQMLNTNLEFLEEKREMALVRLASYHRQLMNQYNKKVKKRDFQVGEFVLRKVQLNTRELNAGKFASNWEGPYQISEVIGKGSYKLSTMEGIPVKRSQNGINLKKYYV